MDPREKASPSSGDEEGRTARRGDHLTDLGLLSLALVWGINFSVLKVALAELHPFAFNALRFPVASVVLYLLLRARAPLKAPPREDVPAIVGLGLLGHVVYQVLFILGVHLTSAGNASLLLATTPVWTLLFSVVRRHEDPPLRVWGGVAGTVAGITLVVLGGGGMGGGSLGGDVLMLAAAVGWSLYTVGSRNLVRRHGALPMTAWTLWVGTAGVLLTGLPWLARTDLAAVSPAAWGGVVYAGALGIAVAYVLWYNGVRRLGNARTAVYSNLVPLVALAAAWRWLGEVPERLQLIGAAVILVSLSVTRFRSGRAGSEAPEGRVVPEST